MNGDRDETKVVARLPGLDIAVVHRGARSGGEEVMVALRAVSPFRAPGHLGAANPLLFWMGLVGAAWDPWLCWLAAVSQPPWVARGRDRRARIASRRNTAVTEGISRAELMCALHRIAFARKRSWGSPRTNHFGPALLGKARG
jgi:hypothetical protein